MTLDLHALTSGTWQARQRAISLMATLEGTSLSELADSLVELVREHSDNLGALNASLQLLARMGKPVVKRLAPLLTHPVNEVRLAAMVVLSHLPNGLGVPLLLEGLEDEDTNLRYHAIEGLGLQKAAVAVPALLSIATGDDFFLAFAAVEALGQIGNWAAIPELVDLLDDSMMGASSAEALGRLGHCLTVPALARALGQTEDPAPYLLALHRIAGRYPSGTRQDAAITATLAREISAQRIDSLLAELRTEPGLVIALGDLVGRVFPVLGAPLQSAVLEILNDKNRAGLLPYLGRLGSEGIPVLQTASQSSNLEIQLLAAEALAELGETAALPYLAEAVASHDSRVSQRAARALGHLPADLALPVLADQLGHPQAIVREAVVQSLSRFAASFPRMVQACVDPDPKVREAGLRWLAAVPTPEAGPFLLQLLQTETQSRVRCAGVEALGSVGSESVSTYIILDEIFEGGHPSERAAVTGILHRLNAQRAEPLLRKALLSKELWTLIYACRALQYLKVSGLVPMLSRLLEDPRPPVRAEAAQALGKLDSEMSLAELPRLLQDEELDVVLAAISGLAATQGEGALPLLLELAQSSTDVVREKALSTLAWRRGDRVLAVLEAALDNPHDAPVAVESLLLSGDPDGRVRLLRKMAPASMDVFEKLSVSARDLTEDIGRILAEGTDAASRVALIELLTRQPSMSAEATLEKMLLDTDPWIRRLSVLSLGDRHWGNGSARSFLQGLHEDPDEGVRRTVRLVLSDG